MMSNYDLRKELSKLENVVIQGEGQKYGDITYFTYVAKEGLPELVIGDKRYLHVISCLHKYDMDELRESRENKKSTQEERLFSSIIYSVYYSTSTDAIISEYWSDPEAYFGTINAVKGLTIKKLCGSKAILNGSYGMLQDGLTNLYRYLPNKLLKDNNLSYKSLSSKYVVNYIKANKLETPKVDTQRLDYLKMAINELKEDYGIIIAKDLDLLLPKGYSNKIIKLIRDPGTYLLKDEELSMTVEMVNTLSEPKVQITHKERQHVRTIQMSVSELDDYHFIPPFLTRISGLGDTYYIYSMMNEYIKEIIKWNIKYITPLNEIFLYDNCSLITDTPVRGDIKITTSTSTYDIHTMDTEIYYKYKLTVTDKDRGRHNKYFIDLDSLVYYLLYIRRIDTTTRFEDHEKELTRILTDLLAKEEVPDVDEYCRNNSSFFDEIVYHRHNMKNYPTHIAYNISRSMTTPFVVPIDEFKLDARMMMGWIKWVNSLINERIYMLENTRYTLSNNDRLKLMEIIRKEGESDGLVFPKEYKNTITFEDHGENEYHSNNVSNVSMRLQINSTNGISPNRLMMCSSINVNLKPGGGLQIVDDKKKSHMSSVSVDHGILDILPDRIKRQIEVLLTARLFLSTVLYRFKNVIDDSNSIVLNGEYLTNENDGLKMFLELTNKNDYYKFLKNISDSNEEVRYSYIGIENGEPVFERNENPIQEMSKYEF